MNSRSTKYILPVVMGGLWILAAPSLSWAQKADSKPAQSAPVEEAAIETPMMMQKTETTTAPTETVKSMPVVMLDGSIQDAKSLTVEPTYIESTDKSSEKGSGEKNTSQFIDLEKSVSPETIEIIPVTETTSVTKESKEAEPTIVYGKPQPIVMEESAPSKEAVPPATKPSVAETPPTTDAVAKPTPEEATAEQKAPKETDTTLIYGTPKAIVMEAPATKEAAPPTAPEGGKVAVEEVSAEESKSGDTTPTKAVETGDGELRTSKQYLSMSPIDTSAQNAEAVSDQNSQGSAERRAVVVKGGTTEVSQNDQTTQRKTGGLTSTSSQVQPIYFCQSGGQGIVSLTGEHYDLPCPVYSYPQLNGNDIATGLRVEQLMANPTGANLDEIRRITETRLHNFIQGQSDAFTTVIIEGETNSSTIARNTVAPSAGRSARWNLHPDTAAIRNTLQTRWQIQNHQMVRATNTMASAMPTLSAISVNTNALLEETTAQPSLTEALVLVAQPAAMAGGGAGCTLIRD